MIVTLLSFCAAVPVSEYAPGSTEFLGLGSESDISLFPSKGSYGLLMYFVFSVVLLLF